MKSILADNIRAFAALVLLICFTGCQKENSTSFTATTQRYEAPKLHIENNIAYWDNNDRVAINDGTYAVSIDGNDNKATIAAEGVTPYGNEYYAAYPAEYATISGSSVTFNVPYSESYTTNGSGQQLVNNIMVGKTNNSHLTFENVGAMLHFQLKGSSTGISKTLLAIEVSCDQPLCGNLTVDMSGNTISSTISGSSSDTARILTFDTPYLLTEDAKDFYLNIPVVTGVTKFRVRYMFNNGGNLKIYEKTKSGSFSFEKGKIYYFGKDNYNGSNVSFDGSNGTPITPGSGDNPLRITSDDIFAVSASSFGQTNRHFILDEDISVSTAIPTLLASFDGNGHTITLTNNNTLFTEINGGTVKNLTIEGNISNPTCSNGKFGAITPYAHNNNSVKATIENCVNKANITCLQNNPSNTITTVGGICGNIAYSNIISCRNEGVINSDANYTGGVVGYCNSMDIAEGCSNTNSIIVDIASTEQNDIRIGGIFGQLSLSRESGNHNTNNCHNSGNITVSGAIISTNNSQKILYCGGCFGQITSQAEFVVERCSNSGEITYTSTPTRPALFGGIAGKDVNSNNYCTMLNCYNVGSITTTAGVTAGGLLGQCTKMNIYNSYAYCNINANTSAGLIADASDLQGNINISNCYYYGTRTANTTYGIAGKSYSSNCRMNLDHCYYPSTITTICGTNTNADNTCGTMSSATDNTTLNNLNSEANSHPDYNHWTTGYNGLESLHIIFQN